MSSNCSSHLDPLSPLNLANIRHRLAEFEDSILLALIQRAKMPNTPHIYQTQVKTHSDSSSQSSSSSVDGTTLSDESILSQFLSLAESFQLTHSRQCSTPFDQPFSHLPDDAKRFKYLSPIHQSRVFCHNDRIKKFYIDRVVPSICSSMARDSTLHEDGLDADCGSICLADVQILQLLSKRIHYGFLVAESKYLSEPESFAPVIRSRDIVKLTEMITKPVVEEKILQRIRDKARQYCPSAMTSWEHTANESLPSSPSSSTSPPLVDVIVKLYDDIMTLTKDVQIEYLLQRLNQ